MPGGRDIGFSSAKRSGAGEGDREAVEGAAALRAPGKLYNQIREVLAKGITNPARGCPARC
jgi:hypothetical protein